MSHNFVENEQADGGCKICGNPHSAHVSERPTVACALCGTPTPMLGTRRCDRCFDLETLIKANPDLSAKILAAALGVETITCEFRRRTNFTDVRNFHDKFGLARDRPTAPRALPLDLGRFRLGFILEEVAEYARAVGYPMIATTLDIIHGELQRGGATYDPHGIDVLRAFDGLLDAVVVILGTADFHGFPWERGWDVVMARNMAKRRAKPDGSDSKRGSPFDVIKPEGWYGPEEELGAMLAALGFIAS